MSKWQPIETAPKDGTEVDLWCAGEKNAYRQPTCHWHCDEWLFWGGDPEIGWVNVPYPPTHWMPLPEPPVVSDRSPPSTSRVGTKVGIAK